MITPQMLGNRNDVPQVSMSNCIKSRPKTGHEPMTKKNTECNSWQPLEHPKRVGTAQEHQQDNITALNNLPKKKTGNRKNKKEKQE